MRLHPKASVVKLLLAFLPLSASMPLAAQEQDFVTASLLISDPGKALYSHFGHAALHLQCPDHNLDYVFSYESEDAYGKILKFFAEELKMGMLAISPEIYYNVCKKQDRGVREYRINLPLEAKRNLWRVLDNRLLEGVELPYDYLHRGCAYSILKILEEGAEPLEIEFGPWPEEYGLSRREIGHKALSSFKWSRWFLHLVCNGEIDRPCPDEDKVITPAQLLEVLSSATVNGVPVLSPEPEVKVERSADLGEGWLSPLVLSILLLIATVFFSLKKKHFIDYLLLAIQTLLGLITVYLVFFSNLVCTEWSWLIIPFNPLPLIFWKWRRYWCLPYAIILLLWSAFMAFWPHLLTDSAYIITASCLSISYIDQYHSKSDEKQ